MSTAREVLTYDQFVDDRLSKVRNSVKLRDLTTGVLLTVSGCLAIIIALVLVDHWCFDLGIVGRLVGFGLLIGWMTYCTIVWLMPPLFRAINPAYAAKVIEDGEPSLKNRLLNFVLFRSHRSELKEVVYHAVREEAASELTDVEVESTVDYTTQVRYAAAMAAMVIALAVYTAVSPKNPLSTLGRIFFPWRSIARPSRVLIKDVEPGATDVYFGRSVSVSATIERLPNDQQAAVVFSSVDDRVVDQRRAMAFNRDSQRHETDLSFGGQGVRQDLSYTVQAGDAVAGPFRVNVVPAPSIIVERVEYEFPEYTNQTPEAIDSEGDISAIEGTRVTIHATTNQPISSAYIEFDPAADGTTSRDRKTVTMSHDDRSASVSFTLKLKRDGSPVHSSYFLRFHNDDREINANPVRYHIDVIPDLKPEVEIVDPTKTAVDVPLNAVRPIDVRAVDPDFLLSRLTLELVQPGGVGEHIETVELLQEPAAGQVTKRYQFSPQGLGLRLGQIVLVRAMAADNHHDPQSRKPRPNTSQTEQYKLRIVRADPNERQRKPDRDDRTQPNREGMGEAADEGQPGEADAGNSEDQGKPSAGNQGGGDEQSGEGGGSEQNGEAAGGQGNDGGGENRSTSNGDNAAGDTQGADGMGGETGEGEGGSGTGEADGENGNERNGGARDALDASQDGGNRNSGGQQSEGGEEAGPNGSSDVSRSNQNSDRSGNNAAEEPKDDGENGGRRGQPSPEARQQGDRRASEPPRDQSPLSSDGSQDPDVFDRVMEEMRRQGKTADPSEGTQEGGDPSSENSGAESETSPRNEENPQPSEPRASETSGDEPQSEGPRNEQAERTSDQSEQAGDDQHAAQQSEKAGDEQQSEDAPQSGNEQQTEDPKQSDADQQSGDQPQSGQPSGDQGQQSPSSESQAADRSNQQGNQSGQPSETSPDAETSRQTSDQQGEEGERQGGSQQGQSGQSQQGAGGQPGREPGGAEDAEGTDTGEPGNSGEGGKSSSDGQPAGSTEGGESDGDRRGDGDETADGPQGGTSSGESGDQSGAGEPERGEGEGSDSGGQPGDQPGANGAASPEGASTSDQPGTNRDSQRTGEGASPSPNAADRGAQPGENGSQAGQQAGDQPAQNSQPGTAAGQTPGQGAQRGSPEAPMGNSNNAGPEPGGDAANLEYANKATELVIDYLKDQQDKPDPELLDRLGWTQEDLRRFLNRWEQMRAAAKQPGQEGEDAQRELDQALRSLGLQPPQDRTRTATDNADDLTDVSDAGTRARPPAQYRERYKSFMQRRQKTQQQ